MSTNYIHQWAIALGFDASAVEKGIAQTTKIMNNASRVQAAAAKPYEQAIKTQNNALREQNKLESKRLSLRRTAMQAETSGLRQAAQMANSAIGGKNLDQLEKRRLTTAKAVLEQKFRQKNLNQQMRREEEAAYYLDRKRTKDLRQDTIQARQAAGLSTRKANMQSSIELLRTGANRIQDPTKRANLNERLNLAAASVSGATSHNQLSGVQGQQIKAIRAETQGLIGDQKRLNDHLARSKWLATGFARSFKNLATSYIGVFGALAGLQAVFRTAKALDSIKASMLAGSGSAKQAAENFDYVRSEAKRLGLDLTSTAKSYSQMSIAAKLAGLSTETTRGIFEGVTEASTAFGLSAEDNEGVLRALTQMLSKNVISAEELRGQMGDRMPIAMGVMAKALKMSTKELDKQMRSGNLIATEVLPKWAKQMRITAREGGALGAGMNTISAAQNRLAIAWTESIEAFSAQGGKYGFVTALNDMAVLLNEMKPLFQFLGWSLSVTVKVAREILGPILSDMQNVLRLSDKYLGTQLSASPVNSPAKNVSSTLASSVVNTSNSGGKTTNINTINFTSTKANAKEVRKEIEDIMQLQWTGMASGPA